MANMKDWKSEYEKMKGRVIQLEKELEYAKERERQRSYRDSEVRDRFKELLLDVLGK